MNQPLDPQQVIAEARAALDTSRRMLAECGVTSGSCLEFLRRTEGPAAAERVRREVAESLRALHELIQQSTSQARPGQPVSRVVAQRRSV